MENVLILGSKGMLGGQLMKLFPNATGWDREDFDATHIENFKSQITNLQPSVIINCVAFNDVDGAEEKQDIAFALNAVYVGKLAALTKELNIPLVHFSTNYVFDGQQGEYQESDTPNPQSVYGKSKYQGELEIQKNTDQYYIIRTAVLFGPKGESELSKKSFVDIMLGLAEKQNEIKAVNDEVSSLTLVTDLAKTVKYILDKHIPYGIYHVANSGQASWYDIAKEIFSILGKQITLIPVPSTEFPRKAVRPKKSVLLNTKLSAIRPWQEALKEFLLSNAQ